MKKVDLSKLQVSTPESEIKHRVHAGKTLSYVDARYCMDMLDVVCGPENWCDDYKEVRGLMMCGVSIKVDGMWITKWDTGTEANFEKEKSIVSGSFKRACVKWGIARDLYENKMAGNKATPLSKPSPTEASSSQGSQPTSYVVSFGKHQGKKIQDVPLDYIQWYLNQKDSKKDPDVHKIFNTEYLARKNRIDV